jgi:hypothetical protein
MRGTYNPASLSRLMSGSPPLLRLNASMQPNREIVQS